jgi:hypothetical protein
MRLIGLCALSLICATPVWSQGELDGIRVYIKNKGNGLYMDHHLGNNNAYLHAYHGRDNQVFKLDPVADGYFLIKSEHNDYCLDVRRYTKNAYFNQDCHGDSNQQFQLDLNSDDNTFTIRPRSDQGQCLDAHLQNQTLYSHNCHAGNNQRFILEAAIPNSNGRHLQGSLQAFNNKVINELKAINEDVEGAEALLGFISVLSIQVIADGYKLKQAYDNRQKQVFTETLLCPGFLFQFVYGSNCWQNPKVIHAIYKLAGYLFPDHHHSQANSSSKATHSAPRIYV